MNTPHLTIDAIVARKADLMGQASPQVVGELIDRLAALERDLLDIRSGAQTDDQAQPIPCPYPCGWEVLHSRVTELGARMQYAMLDEDKIGPYFREELTDLADIAIKVVRHMCRTRIPGAQPALWRVVTQRDHVKTSEYFYTQWQAEEHVNREGGTLQALGVIDSVTVLQPSHARA